MVEYIPPSFGQLASVHGLKEHESKSHYECRASISLEYNPNGGNGDGPFGCRLHRYPGISSGRVLLTKMNTCAIIDERVFYLCRILQCSWRSVSIGIQTRNRVSRCQLFIAIKGVVPMYIQMIWDRHRQVLASSNSKVDLIFEY